MPSELLAELGQHLKEHPPAPQVSTPGHMAPCPLCRGAGESRLYPGRPCAVCAGDGALFYEGTPDMVDPEADG